MAHDNDKGDEEQLESLQEDAVSRRRFLFSLGKWSAVVIGVALLGEAIDSDDEVLAQRRRGGSWVNRRGGGSWVNRSRGGGWLNRGGYRGWVNWINNRGYWVNNSWINRRAGGGWLNRYWR